MPTPPEMVSKPAAEPSPSPNWAKRLCERLKDVRDLFDSARALILSVSGLLGAIGGAYFLGHHSQASTSPQTVVTRFATALPVSSEKATSIVQRSSAYGSPHPPSGAPVGSSVQVTYLSELTPTDPTTLSSGSYTVNGVNYTNSYGVDMLENGSADFNLYRKYRCFQATVGLSDDSPVGETVEFSVSLDGRVVYDKTLRLGTTDTLNLDITGAFRLTISSIANHLTYPGDAVWGDARLS